MNVFALLMLVFFIYSILGVYLFSNISTGEVIDPEYRNFKNFGNAMIMLLRISTGEDWATIMNDLLVSNSILSRIYFISFNLICSNVMINLFVLVIL